MLRSIVTGSDLTSPAVAFALATEMDCFVPDADHINALPGPLRKYIHDLETRADLAGEVAEIALCEIASQIRRCAKYRQMSRDGLFAFVLMPFSQEFDDRYRLGIKET